jgi:hypothetical protein
MKSLVELLVELSGGIILLFTAGSVLARIFGYDEYHDKMLYDEEDKITYYKDDDIINHFLI